MNTDFGYFYRVMYFILICAYIPCASLAIVFHFVFRKKIMKKKIILNHFFFHYALLTLFMLKLNYKSNKGTKYVLADLCEELKKCALILVASCSRRLLRLKFLAVDFFLVFFFSDLFSIFNDIIFNILLLECRYIQKLSNPNLNLKMNPNLKLISNPNSNPNSKFFLGAF